MCVCVCFCVCVCHIQDILSSSSPAITAPTMKDEGGEREVGKEEEDEVACVGIGRGRGLEPIRVACN